MSAIAETRIEADPNVPIIRITREFAGTPEQLFRAHTDPKLFAQWIGPSTGRSWASASRSARCRNGGSRRRHWSGSRSGSAI